MTTRSKAGIFKPKVLTAQTEVKKSSTEPESVIEALHCPKWKAAMEEEYQALIKNQIWKLVSMPMDRKIIRC